MSDKLADQRENLKGDYALVVKLPKQVQEFNDSLTFTKLRRRKEVLSDVFNKGRESGRKINLTSESITE